MSTEVSTRPKLSQHRRRNTSMLRPYVKNLGYSKADWEESLTVKFRDLPSHYDRMYTLFLGCSHGGNDNSSAVKSAVRHEPREVEMSHSQAIAFMARLQETLMHEERTVRGIFEALGRRNKSDVDLRTYSEALEHMSVRTGTAIPRGAAEKALAFLRQHAEVLWPFLQEEVVGSELGEEGTCGKYGFSENRGLGETSLPLKFIDSGTEVSPDYGGWSRAARGTDGQRGAPRDTLVESITIDADDKTYPLARVSAALEAFVLALSDHGVAPGDFPLQDLTNFLYLGGQAKVSLRGLKALVDKYGRWALERNRRELQAERAKLAEAARSAKAGRAFSLTDQQLDAAIDFLDPNQDGNIDLEELMQAFKKQRTAINYLNRDSLQGRSGASMDGGSGEKETGDSMTSPGMGAAPKPREVEEEGISSLEFEEDRHRIDQEERPLFAPEEAELLAAYMVESQQAFSLMSVADIQHGIRSAKRAAAQMAARNVYRDAAKRFAGQLRSTGMAPESDDGWKRWFELCDLGLRADDATGKERLIGRTELKRGLKNLSPLPLESDAIDSNVRKGWSELELDDLLIGLVVLQDGERRGVDSASRGEGEGTKEALDLTENDFRKRLIQAATSGGREVDRDLQAGQVVVPLIERLELYLKKKGMRIAQLFERMTAWAKDASEYDITKAPQKVSWPAAAPTQRGDESRAPPAALLAILTSLKVGGLTGAERLKTKLDRRRAAAEEEHRRVAEGEADEAVKQVTEAEESGASAVLELLRTSVASKSMRVIELFKALDISKDGLLSREELKEGLQIITEGSAEDCSSIHQLRKDCRERKRAVEETERTKTEKQAATRLRARIIAMESSGAARVLRRINDHVVGKGLKLVDMFHSLSLRGHTDLNPAELEMALNLVDGLDLTRREVRRVVRFLDKDGSGTIDVREVEEAVREFRELSRDQPSLGTGPMTAMEPWELRRLAKRSFSDVLMVSSRDRRNPSEGAEGSAVEEIPCRHDIPSPLGHSGHSTMEYAEAPAIDGHDFCEGDGGNVDTAFSSGTGTVSVSEIAEAFEEAFRRFRAEIGGKGESVGEMRYSAFQKQPSVGVKRSQVCVDEVVRWLRSSKTFSRAPTGRMPTLTERMTERQKMELELQKKLQEKRRRAAGQRHWEQWVARTARRRKHENRYASGSPANGEGFSEREDGSARGYRQQEAAALVQRKRDQDQDDAFSTWARKKDKIIRARRREERRAQTAAGTSELLHSVNFKLREARAAAWGRLPRIDSRPESDSLASASNSTGCSLATSGVICSTRGSVTRWSKRGKVPSRAGHKALDLASTRVRLLRAGDNGCGVGGQKNAAYDGLVACAVAVSPYRVRPNEPYQSKKHLAGCEILARMSRTPSRRQFPKALVQEGRRVTSALFAKGSTSMSSIDHSLARRPRAGAAKVDGKDDCGRGKPVVADKSSGSAALGRSRRVPGNCRRKQRHAPAKSAPQLVAPEVDAVGAATLGGEGSCASPGSVDGCRDEPGGSFGAREADATRDQGREAGALMGNDAKGVIAAENTSVQGGLVQGVRERSTQKSICARDAAGTRPDGRRGVRINPRGGWRKVRGKGGARKLKEFRRPNEEDRSPVDKPSSSSYEDDDFEVE